MDDKNDSSSLCAFCNVELIGQSRSKEHVIPNSIGGRLKTADFICARCNSTKGDSWDSQLAQQLNWFSLSLGISRERGEPPRQLVNTVDGRQFRLLPDGSFSPKSSYSEELVEGKKKISIVAASVREARKRLGAIASKYPEFDLEQALSEVQIQSTYLDSPLSMEFSLGGAESGRSLVKTALAFASHCGVPHKEYAQALEYLLDAEAEPPYGHAYLSDLMINRDRKTISHCVSLKSDSDKCRLWSYIEYFGMFRVLVLINDHYLGPPIDKTYAINPITGEEVVVEVSSNIPEHEFLRIVAGNGYDPIVHKAAADFALPILIERSQQRALESAVSAGFNYAAQTLGIAEGEYVPAEKAAEFTALMMEKIAPYLSHLIRSNSQLP